MALSKDLTKMGKLHFFPQARGLVWTCGQCLIVSGDQCWPMLIIHSVKDRCFQKNCFCTCLKTCWKTCCKACWLYIFKTSDLLKEYVFAHAETCWFYLRRMFPKNWFSHMLRHTEYTFRFTHCPTCLFYWIWYGYAESTFMYLIIP